MNCNLKKSKIKIPVIYVLYKAIFHFFQYLIKQHSAPHFDICLNIKIKEFIMCIESLSQNVLEILNSLSTKIYISLQRKRYSLN